MNDILYKSSAGIVTYGLMATLICNNMLGETSIILPEIPYKYKKEVSMISAPRIDESGYHSVSVYTELEKTIWHVLAVLTKEPSQLDLEMLSTMDDDIWDLF